MSRISLLLLSLIAFPFWSLAQSYTGKVVNPYDEPLYPVSVLLRSAGEKSRTLAFTRTNKSGDFRLNAKVKGDSLLFVVRGFERVSLAVSDFSQGQKVVLKRTEIKLREVKVTAAPIKLRGDTLIFNAHIYKQGGDDNISDLLKHLPGVTVEKNGTIKYQGKPINKFYIENMDLLGNKYTQASENISVDKVKSVEVYENHQPVRVLQGKSFSENAAINIVLKDDAKNSWEGLLDLGLGTSLQEKMELLSDSRLMGMFFGSGMQSLSMYKHNNIGDNFEKEIDVRALFGYQAPTRRNILSNLQGTVRFFEPEFSRFNNTHLMATNWLFKTAKKNDLRFQLSGAFDKHHFEQEATRTYHNIVGNPRIEENYNMTGERYKLSGEMLYKVNQDKLYLANTLRAAFNRHRSVGTSFLNRQEVKLLSDPEQNFIANDFELIKRLANDQNLSLKAYLGYTSLPSRLRLIDNKLQELHLGSTVWGAKSYLTQKLGKFNLDHHLRVVGEQLSFHQELGSESAYSRYLNNRVIYKSSLGRRIKGVRLSLSLPITLLTQGVDKRYKHSLLLEPTLSFNFKPTKRLALDGYYAYQSSQSGAFDLVTIPLYTEYDFRTIGRGLFDFFDAHRLNAHLAYKNVPKGVFGSIRLSYNYAPNSSLYFNTYKDNFLTSQRSDLRADSHSVDLDSEVSKSFSSRMSISLRYFMVYNKYHYLKAEDLISAQYLRGFVSLGLTYRPTYWLAINAHSYAHKMYQWEEVNNSINREVMTFDHELNLSLSHKSWGLKFKNNAYHSTDNSVSFAVFSDVELSHKSKHHKYSLEFNNLFGYTTYRREQIFANMSYVSTNYLRPREIILKYTFDF